VGKVYSMARFKIKRELIALEQQFEKMLKHYSENNYNWYDYMILVEIETKILELESALDNLPDDTK